MKGGRIWLPRGFHFIPSRLAEYHSTPSSGHMGAAKIAVRLMENFTWHGLRNDVESFVKACVDCQHAKYETKRVVGLLCPLPVPHHPWEDPSLDFITGLPLFRGNTTILVVVDRFSKGIHLGILPTSHSSLTVATLFIEIVGKIHEMPRSLVSDRDPLFLRMSFAYHPQSDGQIEVLNRIIEQCLRAFIHKKLTTWGKFLPWVEWSHNTSWNTKAGSTPFEITFGRKPFNFPEYLVGTSNIDDVDDLLYHRTETFTNFQKKLLKARC